MHYQLLLKSFILVITTCLLIITLEVIPVESQSCTTIGSQSVVNNGLVSSPNIGGGLDLVKNAESPECVIDPARAQSYQHSIPTFNELVSMYYDQIKESTDIIKHNLDLGATSLQTRLDSNPQTYQLAITSSDYTLNSLNIPSQTVVVLFVEGNLTINQNLTHTNQDQGLVLIIGGNVNIDDNVSRVDDFIITTGRICTHWTGTCVLPVSPPFPPPLTINGSIITLSTDNNNYPRFYRDLGFEDNQTLPSEIINYQPKYLVITKEILGRNTRIWSEVQ